MTNKLNIQYWINNDKKQFSNITHTISYSFLFLCFLHYIQLLLQVYHIMLIIPFLSLMIDFVSFDKNSGFKLFQIFNIIFYLWIFILIFISFFIYLKSKNGIYEIFSILFLVIFLAYNNDFVVFKETESLREIYIQLYGIIFIF